MKYNIEEIKKECENRNCKFIDFYKKENNGKYYVKYICNIHTQKGELETRYDSFKGGSKCKFCATKKSAINRNGIFKTNTNDNFIKQIYELVKDEYTVLGEYINANTKILIKHNICENEYKDTPMSFLRGKRCPFCVKKYKNKTTESFIKEVYELVKDEYTVLGEYLNSATKILIKHNVCGKDYLVNPNKFLFGNRCPYCHKGSNNKSKLAHKIELFLTLNKINYKKEFRFNDCRDLLPLPFDFAIFDNNEIYCLIEADGAQHFDRNNIILHNGKLVLHDKIKNDFFKKNNIKLIRIPFFEFKNIEKILVNKLSKNLFN